MKLTAFFARHLHRRLMLSFSVFTLAVATLFGLFAMIFVYTVEDRFIDRWLVEEGARIRALHATSGSWPSTRHDNMRIALNWDELPRDISEALKSEPHRREIAGNEGRHYHLLALAKVAEPPWLVAEVSNQLLVRPMRDKLLRWLIGWGVIVVGLSLLLAWLLARRTSAPLARIASQLANLAPESAPNLVPENRRHDEVGAVARSLDASYARVAEFVAREQAFTRDASHELRTPLTVLRMSIERLRSETHTAETLRVLNAMHASTLLMQQTVETMLQIAREDALPLASVPLLPMVERWALAHSSWLDEQSLRLQVELAPTDRIDLPEVIASLVIANLLHNAFTHGGPNGAVIVSMRGRRLHITNPARPAPFADARATTDRTGGAHGFGLTIVRRLLSRYRATLAVTYLDDVVDASVECRR